MGIVLSSLSVHGPDREIAEVTFDPKRCLIRGPSETGKSHIFDTLWYMLGGGELPTTFPLMQGYQEYRLRFTASRQEYEVRRAINGGLPDVYVRALGSEDEQEFETQKVDLGALLVELAGAKGKQILRTHSDRGAVTGDDVRHWALWSQTELPSKAPTIGSGYGASKREASFHLFLTGTDDSAINTRTSKTDAERAKGALAAAEDALARVNSIIPDDLKREEVEDALERVDDTLSAMTTQYEARASILKILRKQIGDANDSFNTIVVERKHAQSMISRFELLDNKYSNDLARLGATCEGVAFFEELPMVDCPLCNTPTASQVDPHDLRPSTPGRYRKAIAAEAEKIRALRGGLLGVLEHERSRFSSLSTRGEALYQELETLQNREATALQKTRVEFSADPKTLALKRSELASHLGNFDEVRHLTNEIARLSKLTVRKRITVNREGGTFGRAVADTAKVLLNEWGLDDIENISLDDETCDLLINDRARLSFGAGIRGLYLSALMVAFMEHALMEGLPHLGLVVLDSPLKAYADPKSIEVKDVPVATVNECFYKWLSEWSGKGQVIVLENEDVLPKIAEILKPIVFTRMKTEGRYGFYPLRDGVKVEPPAVNDIEGAELDDGE